MHKQDVVFINSFSLSKYHCDTTRMANFRGRKLSRIDKKWTFCGEKFCRMLNQSWVGTAHACWLAVTAAYDVLPYVCTIPAVAIVIHTKSPGRYCIVEKLWREKTFTNFAAWEPPAKVFSTKFLAHIVLLVYPIPYVQSCTHSTRTHHNHNNWLCHTMYNATHPRIVI